MRVILRQKKGPSCSASATAIARISILILLFQFSAASSVILLKMVKGQTAVIKRWEKQHWNKQDFKLYGPLDWFAIFVSLTLTDLSFLSPLLLVLELAFELNDELLDPAPEPTLKPRFLWTKNRPGTRVHQTADNVSWIEIVKCVWSIINQCSTSRIMASGQFLTDYS